MVKAFLVKIFYFLCQLIPISNRKIVFANYNGQGYGDSLKYIAEELITRNLHYDLVWLVKDTCEVFPKGIRTVPYLSIRARLELSSAKIIIRNTKDGLYFPKRKKQFYLQTWHGDFPLKFIEKEAEDKLLDRYVRASKEDSSITDMILAGTHLMHQIISDSFWYNGDIFDAGSPRNDIYFVDNNKRCRTVKDKLAIGSDTHVAMYAPTFRNDKESTPFFNPQEVLNALEKATSFRWVLLIRMHPNVRNQGRSYVFSDSIIDCSFYPDSQDLCLISDLLITDYSSIMFDFMLLKRNILLYIPDLLKYKEERGLRDIYDNLPFCKCASFNSLLLSIENRAFVLEEELMDRFISEYVGSYDDGRASERVVDKLISVSGS